MSPPSPPSLSERPAVKNFPPRIEEEAASLPPVNRPGEIVYGD